jgi:hypothetical protein
MTPLVARRFGGVGRELLCLGIFVVLTAVATYPLLLRFTDAVPFGGGDAWQNYWNLWWVKKALLELHSSPYFTRELFFPYGTHLYFHTLNPLNGVLALPVILTAGLTAGYNFLVFLTFGLSGYATYRLALYVLRDTQNIQETMPLHLAAFVAGVTFTFSSYRSVHLLGHLDLLSTQWLPLFVLLLLKTRDDSDWRSPLLAAISLGATALTAMYYVVFLFVFAALLTVQVIVSRGREAWRAVGRIGVVLVAFAVIASPLLIPMLTLGRTFGRAVNVAYDVDRFSADLVGFVVPSILHPLWGSAARPVHEQIIRNNAGLEGVVFLGFMPVALGLVGMIARPARTLFWTLALLVFVLLALGPTVHLAGRVIAPAVSPVMPYTLLMAIPYGDIQRVPARFVVMAVLCLSVLAGFGSFAVLTGQTRRGMSALVALGAGVIVLENAVVPLPLAAVDIPPYYDRLAADPRRAGVLEVPIPNDQAAYSHRMLYQTRHGKPVYGGYLSRGLPPLPFDGIPGFAQFKTLSDGVDDVIVYDTSVLPAMSRGVLRAYSAAHLVIDRDVLDAVAFARIRNIADALLGPSSRTYEDETRLAYSIPESDEAGPSGAWLDTGWSYLERLNERDQTGRTIRWRWMAERARLGITSARAANARLRMTARAFDRSRRLKISLDGLEVATLTVSESRADYDTPAFRLDPGTRFVTLESLDGADSPGVDPRRLSVALFRVELLVE